MNTFRILTSTAIATLLFPSLLAAAPGGVAVFENVAGSIGSVRTYDELTGTLLGGPAQLDGIRLLPIDFSDRSTLTEFLPGRPRLHEDLPGAGRIALPHNRGSLYRYARPAGGGAETYGFFRVAADGSAQALLEIPGIGPTGGADPFVPRIAVASSGDAFLCATKPDAGGNALEVRLAASPSVVDRTAGIPPLRFSGTGLALLPDFGVAVSNRALLRFDRSTTADAVAVSTAPDPLPNFYAGQLVSSRNGAWVATTAGTSGAALHVYTFGAIGNARRASSTPQALSPIGVLPDAPTGPYLAVSDDGAWCAWRLQGTATECMLGRAQPLPGVAPDQITASPDFVDTLDEVGLFHFLPTGALIVGIGERAQPSGVGLEKVDLFQVTPPAGAGSPTILNLTLSSGSASPPFTNAPTIEAQRITLLPDESAVLLYDDSGSSGPLLAAVPGQAGPITVLSNLKSLDLLEIVGRRILIAARTANGAQDEQLYRGPTSLGSPPVLIASHPAGTQYLHPTPRRDGWTSFVTADLNGQVLSRVQLLNGVLQVYPGAPTVFGTSFGHSALGSLVFSLGSSGSPATFFTWPLGGGPSVMLQAPNAPGFVLPGI